MTRKEIESGYQQILRMVLSGQLAQAFSVFRELIRQSTRSDHFYELSSLEENYRNLLKYTYEGDPDPQRDAMLSGIKTSMLALADNLYLHLTEKLFPFRNQVRLAVEKGFGADPSHLTSLYEEMLIHRQVNSLTGQPDEAPVLSDLLFNLIVQTTELPDEMKNLMRETAKPDVVSWPDRCLTVSALTISLLGYFDPAKFELLGMFIQAREQQVYQRALTGMVLGLIRYNDRIFLYPEISSRMADLLEDPVLQKETETIILQLLMAGETERITREFETEVLPDMQKMMPRISDKLGLDDVVEEDSPEGGNPGWKDLMEEVPGLFEKIEKFSRMQMEGADVFMSTFALLKRFDFFNEMRNWFVPFYAGHPAIQPKDMSGDILERLIGGLERAFYICNSDKYSFALNFNAIPSQQRSMIVTHFEAELEQMKELASEEELLDPTMTSNAIYTQYIQDLYRFFKLYPGKTEFEDIFQWTVRYDKLSFIPFLSDHILFAEQLAAFYFSKDHWHEAIAIYQHLEHNGLSNSMLYQKLGYAYQKTGQYGKAAEAYRKAELFDTDRLWILKKLTWCSIRLEQYDKALGYIREASKLQPDDLNLLSQAGQCHLHLKSYKEALEVYSRVRFFSPENLKALRPIGYCRFVLGQISQAGEAYREIINSSEQPGPYDLMNAGHVALCSGDRVQAREYYTRALQSKELNADMFRNVFLEDSQHLIRNGIQEEDIPLLIDFILLGNAN